MKLMLQKRFVLHFCFTITNTMNYCEIRRTFDMTLDTRFNTTFKNRTHSFQSFKSIPTDIVIIFLTNLTAKELKHLLLTS